MCPNRFLRSALSESNSSQLPHYMERRTSSSAHETNTRKDAPIEYKDDGRAKGKRKAGWPKRELEDENPNCVICLDLISEKCVATPCRHSYDYVCILNWLDLRQSCPLCNALVEGLLVHTKDGKIYKHNVEAPRAASAPISNAASSSGLQQIALRNRTLTSRRSRRRSPSPVSEDIALLRRRYVYKHKLRSLYVGSNRMSRFRNVTPRDFCNDEELVSRARMWIRRELRVWEWTSGNAEFLIEYVVGILKSVDLRGSAGQAEEMLSEIFGRENAQIFIHELNAFVRSPYTTLQPFDNFVQYQIPLPRSLVLVP
ncbi:hypothetical protein EV426DRAFT_600523 [Tirmania nivea]|nr:hypothetical protein EV426DRAFT_600523 [Tirmania nivea]